MNNLENILKSHGASNEQFSNSFTENVMNQIKSLTTSQFKVITMWQSRVWKLAAACFVGCIISIYALDGAITVDSILGLSEYSDIEISQSYQTYSDWDAEY